MLKDHLVSAAYNTDWKFKTMHAKWLSRSHTVEDTIDSGILNTVMEAEDMIFFFFATSQKKSIYLLDSISSLQEVRWVIICVSNGRHFQMSLITVSPWKHSTAQHNTTQHTLCINGINPFLVTFSYCPLGFWRAFAFVSLFFVFFPLSLKHTTCRIVL